jgi:hypothetical protein
MINKILLTVAICVSILIGAGQPLGNAMAAQAITVTFNGETLNFDVSPISENGRVLVPLRAIFEKLDATVDWDSITNTVTAVKDTDTVKLTVGNRTAYKNNTAVELDVPSKVVNGRTLVPIRFVSEALGAVVRWKEESSSVIVLSEDFVTEQTASLIQKIESALVKGIDDAHQLIGNEYYNWRPLLDLAPAITEKADSFIIYNLWFPEGEAKQFIVRVTNRPISGDRKPYSPAWIESGPSPVEDVLVYIDLRQDSFSIKWVGYLTPTMEQVKIHFDDNQLDRQLKVILGDEWGYIRMFGDKPEFIKKLKGYANTPIGGFPPLENSYPELGN